MPVTWPLKCKPFSVWFFSSMCHVVSFQRSRLGLNLVFFLRFFVSIILERNSNSTSAIQFALEYSFRECDLKKRRIEALLYIFDVTH